LPGVIFWKSFSNTLSLYDLTQGPVLTFIATSLNILN
jgi:hypothetical protein